MHHSLGRRASLVAGHSEGRKLLLQEFLQYHHSHGAVDRWTEPYVTAPQVATRLTPAAPT